MAAFSDAETLCRLSFSDTVSKYEALWHICTPGEFAYSFNETEDDFKFAVSNMAISAAEAGVIIISDQVMSNHIHTVAACSKDRCSDFLSRFEYRERKHLERSGRPADISCFRNNEPIPITSLEMVRKEIVYCNRNGYVTDHSMTPFSYRWGGGSLYFNCFAQNVAGTPADRIAFKEKRRLSCRSVFDFPDGYRYQDGMILPSSYVEYRLGQSFFRNAHHYFSMLSKNYEAYSEEAERLGDKIVVTDEEMYSIVRMMIKRDHGGIHPSLLPPSEKVEIARILHIDYHASNQQIRRLLKMNISDVNSLFPLTSM